MKSAIFLVVCAVAVFVSADLSTPSTVQKFMEECAESTGVDKGNLEHYSKAGAKKPTEDEMECFEACMMTKLGHLDDFGKMSDELIRKNAESGTFEENKQKANDVYEKCKSTNKYNICKLWTCMKNEAQTHLFQTLKPAY